MTEWNELDRGEATGHAAVGLVRGQQLDDGSEPRLVEIEYRRDGETHTATVFRVSNALQVEFSDADTARFWTEDTDEIIVDAVLRARPVEGPR